MYKKDLIKEISKRDRVIINYNICLRDIKKFINANIDELDKVNNEELKYYIVHLHERIKALIYYSEVIEKEILGDKENESS